MEIAVNLDKLEDYLFLARIKCEYCPARNFSCQTMAKDTARCRERRIKWLTEK